MFKSHRADLARALDRIADVLAEQAAGAACVERWRAAAAAAAGGQSSLLMGAAGAPADPAGETGLAVDGRIARQARQFLKTGRMSLLERIEGRLSPEEELSFVPGIGPTLARRIVALGVETLDDVRAAGAAGVLARIAGLGPLRAQALVVSLEGLVAGQLGGDGVGAEIAMAGGAGEILALDAEYRQRAADGELVPIATARHGAGRGRWLPVMHVDRENWTVMLHFANSARVHAEGNTGNWVVVHCTSAETERQYLVRSEGPGNEPPYFERLTRTPSKRNPSALSRPSRSDRSSGLPVNLWR